MNKPIKQRKCASRTCREIFTPQIRGLRITKHCSAACELDDAESKGNAIKKPKAKPKLRKVAAVKNELWELFSLHQKLVHSVDGKWCNCYTCGKLIEIGTIDCQGGHAFSKAANPALWFDERAVRPQCSRCNCAEEGNHYIFNERLKQEIGLAAWNDMYDNRKTLRTESRQIYLDKIAYYKAQIKLIRDARAN